MLGLARRSVKISEKNLMFARAFHRPVSHIFTGFSYNSPCKVATINRLLHSTKLYCNKNSNLIDVSDHILISTDVSWWGIIKPDSLFAIIGTVAAVIAALTAAIAGTAIDVSWYLGLMGYILAMKIH